MTTINDREWAFLAEATGKPGPFNDMYFRYLRGMGYTGTLQDMIAKYGGGLTPSKGGGVPAGYSRTTYNGEPVTYNGKPVFDNGTSMFVRA